MARPRRSRQSPINPLLLLLIAGIIYAVRSCQQPPTAPQKPPRPPRTAAPPVVVPSGRDSNEGNLLLGNPSNAGRDENNSLLDRPQYTMSYNRSRGGPNWVAWHTDAEDLGDLERGKFRPDPDLPKSWQITPKDYTGSGYDRGHVCPSGDRTARREDNDATFYMSNMLPQTAELNQHVWADFEDQCRTWVKSGMELYIVAGGTGVKETIARGEIAVPQSCWKIVVALPEGTNDLNRVAREAKIIAVMMPNEKSDALERGKWLSFRTTPAQIEKITGLRFFGAIPKNVGSNLTNRSDEF